MDRKRGGVSAQAEDLLRLLAAAISAVRLYPTTSPLRLEAITRCTQEANGITAAHGAIQYRIDRTRFILGETPIGEGLPQVAAFSETLHALQVGQLIIAPGLREAEVAAFLDVVGGDTSVVRASGGVRKALLDRAVANIAVIEVTLRASDEEGLLGLDLTTAPPEDIARELKHAVEAWSAQEEDRSDTVAEAVGRLEPAARDLAMRRCAEALLLLDEATRLQMLASALPSGASGQAMDGMLEVVAHMPPAALARLLKLTAANLGTAPDGLLGSIELPAELLAELAVLLKPSPTAGFELDATDGEDAAAIASEVAASDEEDFERIDVLVTSTTPRSAAARGLATTVRMASVSRSDESVRAIADAMRAAAREGALEELAEAALFLRSVADDTALATALASARAVLHGPDLLMTCAMRLSQDPESSAARELLSEAGASGAEALVAAYLQAGELQRAHMGPAMGNMIETVAPVAGRVLRSGDTNSAAAVLRLLGAMNSRRLAPTIASGLEHLDSRVREAAIVALADSPGPESSQLLQKALSHWDPETRRAAAREIGRTRNEDALPALLKIVGEINLFERNYELKKEVLKSLEAIKSPRAVPVLRRLANNRFVLGKKNRELSYLARRVLESLE